MLDVSPLALLPRLTALLVEIDTALAVDSDDGSSSDADSASCSSDEDFGGGQGGGSRQVSVGIGSAFCVFVAVFVTKNTGNVRASGGCRSS